MSVDEYRVGPEDANFGIAMAACVTVLDAPGREGAWRVLGEGAASRGVLSIDDADKVLIASDNSMVLQLWSAGQDQWVLLEANGYWGSMADTLIAAGCREAGSAFWNVNALMSYVEVRSGVLRREFDPVFLRPDPEEMDGVPDAGRGTPFPEEDELPFFEEPGASALALLSIRTGVDLRATVLRAPRETWVRPLR